MKITYEQARADHEYLWAIGDAYDMTGAYTDQDDLVELLKSPTKQTATRCYCRQIGYWFHKGPDINGAGRSDWRELNDPVVTEIAGRHGIHTDEVRHD